MAYYLIADIDVHDPETYAEYQKLVRSVGGTIATLAGPEEGLRFFVEAAFYVQRLMGEPIREIADTESSPTNARVASISVQINDRIAL